MMIKENVKFLNSINEHVLYIDIAIKETVKSVYAWLDGKQDEMMESVKKATQAEKDANVIKLTLLKKIAEAQGMLNRTDFLRLVLKMDLIPDYIEGVAVRISKIKFKPKKAIGDKIKLLCDVMVEMGTILKMCIKSILDNPKKTEGYCNQIDDCEEKVDDIYRDLEADLFQSDIEVKTMLQIRNAMNQIEETGDLCHENADHIRILIATF
jgi:uncharacterized protein Yka (UPF0111/DUF47 family)